MKIISTHLHQFIKTLSDAELALCNLLLLTKSKQEHAAFQHLLSQENDVMKNWENWLKGQNLNETMGDSLLSKLFTNLVLMIWMANDVTPRHNFLVAALLLLRRRKQYNMCQCILQAAIEEARFLEDFELLVKLLTVEMEIQPFVQTSQRDMELIASDSYLARERWLNFGQYLNITTQIYKRQLKKDPTVHSSEKRYYANLLDNPILQRITQALSKKAMMQHHLLKGILNRFIDNADEAFKYYGQLLQLYHQNPHLQRADANTYFSSFNNFIETAITLHKYDEALEAIKKFKNTDARYYQAAYIAAISHEIDINNRLLHFEANLPLIKGVQDYLKKYKKIANTLFSISLFGHMIYTYYGLQQFDKALYWAERLLNEHAPNNYISVHLDAYIFRLIIAIDTGNYKYWQQYLRDADQYLSEHGQKLRYAVLLIDFFKHLNVQNYSNLVEECKTYKPWLNSVLPNNFAPDHRNFNIITWMDSKIQHTSYLKLIKTTNNALATAS